MTVKPSIAKLNAHFLISACLLAILLLITINYRIDIDVVFADYPMTGKTIKEIIGVTFLLSLGMAAIVMAATLFAGDWKYRTFSLIVYVLSTIPMSLFSDTDDLRFLGVGLVFASIPAIFAPTIGQILSRQSFSVLD